VKPFIATVFAFMLLAATASAQTVTPVTSAQRTRRTTTKPTTTKSTTTQKRRTTSPLDATRFNQQRLELAGLSKDMTRFLYLYGRLSKDLELTGAQATSADATNKAKAGLIDNVHAMRDRLDQLESHFRFTKGLETQYQTLQGVSARADEAAQAVSANQYDRGGRILLDIATQLTDVLLELQ
jgi:hypothetical protein